MKVKFNNVDYPITNNRIKIDTTKYYYSEYPVDISSGTVTIGSDQYTLTLSEAKTVLEKGMDETVKLRVRGTVPRGNLYSQRSSISAL
jgi:hypothetical protein